MRSNWDSDQAFGFAGASAGGDTATAAAPGLPAVSSGVGPAPNALHALVDPRGSAVFWITAAAVIGLGMVSGQVALGARIGRAGKK